MAPSDRVAALIALLDQLVDDAITEGAERLPPERHLADRLGTSRSSLRRALEDLERRHRVFRIPGRSGGAYLTAVREADPIPPVLFDVSSRKVIRDLSSVKGVPQMLTEQGFTTQTKVISAAEEPAPPTIARSLHIPAGSTVVSLLRLRLVDNEPMSLERMFLSATRFPHLLEHSPILSMYGLLEHEYGLRIRVVEESIDVAAADAQVATLLRVRRQAPLLALRRIGSTDHDEPIEASIDLFSPERVRLTVRTVVG